jgi:hypothetical protein
MKKEKPISLFTTTILLAMEEALFDFFQKPVKFWGQVAIELWKYFLIC